ncbi:hypothetical protein CR513_01139, partial [Mucuna pruriens]
MKQKRDEEKKKREKKIKREKRPYLELQTSKLDNLGGFEKLNTVRPVFASDFVVLKSDNANFDFDPTNSDSDLDEDPHKHLKEFYDARNLISNMADNTQQFGVRGFTVSKVVNEMLKCLCTWTPQDTLDLRLSLRAFERSHNSHFAFGCID